MPGFSSGALYMDTHEITIVKCSDVTAWYKNLIGTSKQVRTVTATKEDGKFVVRLETLSDEQKRLIEYDEVMTTGDVEYLDVHNQPKE